MFHQLLRTSALESLELNDNGPMRRKSADALDELVASGSLDRLTRLSLSSLESDSLAVVLDSVALRSLGLRHLELVVLF